jgi:hypothetical protein
MQTRVAGTQRAGEEEKRTVNGHNGEGNLERSLVGDRHHLRACNKGNTSVTNMRLKTATGSESTAK